MNVIETALPGVLILEPRVFRDQRGSFVESWQRDRYRDAGLNVEFVQDNVSVSHRGVLRGLHFQHPGPQAKLVTALTGTVFDVAVDIRVGSPNLARWVGVELSGDSLRQLYVPEGFAHGFLVLSETACVSYKCSRHYEPAHDRGVRWNDPEIGVEWPMDQPILSAKDFQAPRLAEIPPESLPQDPSH
jgi:dTDP-4-dehydrorhamnose 3,5-epimerase